MGDRVRVGLPEAALYFCM